MPRSFFLQRLITTRAPASVILIRLMAGAVFLSEGIQKFLYPADIGAGRFAEMGFGSPEFVASLVGTFEITCGALLLLGLLTRAAAIPLVIIMLTAIITTKVPILIGTDLGAFEVRDLDRYGFWAMAHETRTDWAMLLGSLFLLIQGAGRWSVDAALMAAESRPQDGT